MIGKTFGPYKVVAKLGEGGMGEVYRARDTKLDRDVALKILPATFAADPDRLMRFEREAKILAALNHPNIAQIYGIGEAGVEGQTAASSRPPQFLVMELVEGEDLSGRISRGPVPNDEALAIAQQIADALEAAHEQGIVHRDLKPANIKVRAEGAVKVLDFGLAKALDSMAGSASPFAGRELSDSPTITNPVPMTRAGVILGTAAYMAPEQARGKSVDKRTDIWAFGCVLYEMLTGRRAFDGETVTDVLAAVVNKNPDWSALPAATPPSVRRLLERCLTKDPKQRLRDIGDARFELDRTGVERPGDNAPAAASPHRPWVALALVTATAAMASVATWMLSLRATPATGRGLRVVTLTQPGDLEFRDSFLGMGVNTLNPTVSPDGSKVLLQIGGHLWIRHLDQLNLRPLDGTAGAIDAIWSPDSSTVAFLTATELRRVSVRGGPSTLVAQVPGVPIGATWGDDDRIVLSIVGRGLLAVSSQGGALEPLLPPDSSRGDFDFHAPTFLTGSKDIMFVVHADDFSMNGVDLIHGSTRRSLWRGPPGSSVSRALITPDGGTLVVWTERVNAGIWSVPIDLRTGTAGDATLLVPDGLAPSVARDGTLVYTGGLKIEPDSLVRVDRKGRLLRSIGRPLWDMRCPVLSPDGTQVVTWARNDGPADLWVHDVARGTTSRITSDPASEGQPIWTPAGDAVIYGQMMNVPAALVAGRASPDEQEAMLFRKSADGSGTPQRLVRSSIRVPPGRFDIANATISSDGRMLVYETRGSAGEGSDLWLSRSDVEASIPIVATFADESEPAIHPDGALLAYVSNESRRPEVYLQPLPQGRRVQVSVDGGELPAWSRDGKELFFLQQYSIMSVRVERRDNITVGLPVKLFSSSDVGSPLKSFRMRLWCPTDDGFLVVRRGASGKPVVVAMENWQKR